MRLRLLPFLMLPVALLTPMGPHAVAAPTSPPATPRGSIDAAPLVDGCGLKDSGCLRRFPGAIVYSSNHSAGFARGAILDHYASHRWENGFLGYPIDGERCGWVRGGCFTPFDGGSIYWSPATRAHSIGGAIRDKWGSIGWEAGKFGYPVTDEFCELRDGGCGQHFELENGSIYWSPRTEAHTVQGAIKQRWSEFGWERGALGYPRTDEFTTPDGIQQNFEGGFLFWTGTDVYGGGWAEAAENPTYSPEVRSLLKRAQTRRGVSTPTRTPAIPRSDTEPCGAFTPSFMPFAVFSFPEPTPPLMQHDGLFVNRQWFTPLECGDSGYGYRHIRRDHHELDAGTRWDNVFTLSGTHWYFKMKFTTFVVGLDPATTYEPNYENETYEYTSKAYFETPFRNRRIRVVISATNHGRIVTSYPLAKQ